MIKIASIEINNDKLSIETGRVAKQASGSVVVTYGETVVLVTAVSTDEIREGVDFLPLSVEYKEMSYAGGRFPGNYFRRDMGRPGEKETLTARLIDRPLRPLFPDHFHNETQIIASVLSTDRQNEADVLAILGASAALEVSDIPFGGPIGAVRVGRVSGAFIINPSINQQEESDIDLIVAGTRSAVVMVEGGGNFVSEADMIDAVFTGQQAIQPMIDMQLELKRDAGKQKKELAPVVKDEEMDRRVAELASPKLREVITTPEKILRQNKREQVFLSAMEELPEEYLERGPEIREIIHDLEKNMVRKMMLEEGRRIDGRSFGEVRPIECLVGILPRVHGSALFTRGETQAMVLTTLGTEMDEQRIDTIYGNVFRNFILH